MKFNDIARLWRVWVPPTVAFWCAVVVLGVLFQHLTRYPLFQGEGLEYLEIALTYVLGAWLLIMCWLIVWRFEKAAGKPARKSTKIGLKIFTALYLVSLIITFGVKVVLYCLML